MRRFLAISSALEWLGFFMVSSFARELTWELLTREAPDIIGADLLTV